MEVADSLGRTQAIYHMAIPEAMIISVKVKANSQNLSAAVNENKRIGPRRRQRWNGSAHWTLFATGSSRLRWRSRSPLMLWGKAYQAGEGS